MMDGEDEIQVLRRVQHRAVGVLMVAGTLGKAAVVQRQVVDQKRVALVDGGYAGQAHLLDHPVLKDLEHPFHPALGTQYGHCIDLVPTVLEALDIEAPATIRGVSQAPIDGISFAHTFNDGDAPSNHHTQYFEMFAHRAIYHDGWRAVCPWPGVNFTEAAKKGATGSPITNDVLLDIETHDWELYNVDEDPARRTTWPESTAIG